MLSVMTVVGTLSRTSSQAVSRAPCRNGRVSSAKTCDDLALLGRGANHAERRAVAGRRQRAGVAVRENARVRPARRPRRSGPSPCSSRRPRRESRCASRSSRAFSSSTDSPACTPAANDSFMRSIAQNRFTAVGRVAGHQVAELVELDRELPVPCALLLLHAERDAHRRRHADRRRAANHHRLDRARDFGRGLAAHVDFLAGQLALIDHHDGVRLPLDRREHEHTGDDTDAGTPAVTGTEQCHEVELEACRDAASRRTAATDAPSHVTHRARLVSSLPSNGSGSRSRI